MVGPDVPERLKQKGVFCPQWDAMTNFFARVERQDRTAQCFHGGAKGVQWCLGCIHGAWHVHKFRGSSSTQSQKSWSCWEKVVAVHPAFSRILGLSFLRICWIVVSCVKGRRSLCFRLNRLLTWEWKTKIMNWSDIQTSLNHKTKQPTPCAPGEVHCQARGFFYINICYGGGRW